MPLRGDEGATLAAQRIGTPDRPLAAGRDTAYSVIPSTSNMNAYWNAVSFRAS